MIRPLPENQGVGFFSMERLPDYAEKYREVNVGRFWNYHFTADNYLWPDMMVANEGGDNWHAELIRAGHKRIDAFSPNLNKTLRLHHLRQLALAVSMCRTHYQLQPVAIMGASLGVLSDAMPKFEELCKFLNYKPQINYDVLQPWDYVPRRDCTEMDEAIYKDAGKTSPTGCQMWDGPNGPLIVVRSNGKPNYVFYDIAFARNVNPHYYITGVEQKEHFEALGMGDRHFPMGLVLGKDGKKMKSRDGDAPSADEIMAAIKERLKETPEPDKLAWNVLAWNFLHTSRPQNVKYDPDGWTDPDAPGMYVTYTYARIRSALKNKAERMINPDSKKAYEKIGHSGIERLKTWDAMKKWSRETPDERFDLSESDLDLLGTANYHDYYHRRCVESMDPAQLANFAHTLARKLGLAYHREKIQDGRYGFQFAVSEAVHVLREVMHQTAMFCLDKV